jgi:hypothetical protein
VFSAILGEHQVTSVQLTALTEWPEPSPTASSVQLTVTEPSNKCNEHFMLSKVQISPVCCELKYPLSAAKVQITLDNIV